MNDGCYTRPCSPGPGSTDDLSSVISVVNPGVSRLLISLSGINGTLCLALFLLDLQMTLALPSWLSFNSINIPSNTNNQRCSDSGISSHFHVYSHFCAWVNYTKEFSNRRKSAVVTPNS
ncbi:hypothetical protein J6590_089764 [Homalodisca vitripennis]|nr:hypothetical protein J6590_089764 [Homalodisca vitripennis]